MLHGDLLTLFNLTGKMTQGHLSQGRMRESGTHFSVNLSTCNSAKPEARKHPNSANKLTAAIYFHFQLCGHFHCPPFYLQLLQSTVTKALFTRHSAQHPLFSTQTQNVALVPSAQTQGSWLWRTLDAEQRGHWNRSLCKAIANRREDLLCSSA